MLIGKSVVLETREMVVLIASDAMLEILRMVVLVVIFLA